VRVSAGGAIPLSTRTRVSVQGYVGTQRFSTYTGLSNNFIGTQGDFFFRTSGEFGAPTYGAFARTAKEEYESTLRDGYRHAFGVTVQKPVTDRVQLFGALTGTSATEKAPSSTPQHFLARERRLVARPLGHGLSGRGVPERRLGVHRIAERSDTDPGVREHGRGNIIQDDAFNDTARRLPPQGPPP